MKKNKKTSPKRFWGVFLLSVCTLLILAFFIFILGFDVVKKGWSELRNSKIELKSGQEVSAEVISPTGPFYGYGSGVIGGNDKTIVWVTSLNDSGAGSLRNALASGNKWIKFKVGGDIVLGSELKIPSNVTLDGLSAPSPGITIKNNRVAIQGTTNIIIQGIRFRGPAYDTLRVWYGASNIVIDHCSLSGSTDGGLDVTEGAHDITLSWNVIAKTAGEGKGMLIKYGAYHISLHHNIFIDNTQRNPQIGGEAPVYYKGAVNYQAPVVDMRNNIIWNWSSYGTWVTSYPDSPKWGGSANIVNNLYSSKTRPQNALIIYASSQSTSPAYAYIAGNISLTNVSAAPQYMTNKIIKEINEPGNHPQFSAPSYTTEPAIEAARRTVAGAGVRPLDNMDQTELNTISIPGGTDPPSDTTAPTVTIVSPTNITTDQPTINISGTASDNVGVTAVKYESDTGSSGNAQGTTSWTINGFTLKEGDNKVNVYAFDVAGNKGSASITIKYTPTTPPPPPPPPPSGKIELKIQSGADDGLEVSSTGLVNLKYPTVRLGGNSLVGLRFRGINIPKGATITKAILKLHDYAGPNNSVSLEYRADAKINSDAIKEEKGNLSSRSLASAKVNDTPGKWTLNQFNVSPDLSNIVQELVNNSSWTSGNTMTFLIKDSGSSSYRTISAFERGTDKAPTLLVEYK